jgi:hypothetical protein
MKASGYYAVLGLGILVMGLIAWFGWRYQQEHARATAENTALSNVSADLTGQAIYTNGTYGLSVIYPEGAKVEDNFSNYYHLPANWRANALTNATGTPVIAIVGYRVEHTVSYPRYFDAEVRIGVSADRREIDQCLRPTVDQGETALPDVTYNGIPWKVFAFQNAGMMQYVKGVSYRTVHEGKCVAVEQIQTGSSYRDDEKSTNDIPDSLLQKHYDDLNSIIQGVMFARP